LVIVAGVQIHFLVRADGTARISADAAKRAADAAALSAKAAIGVELPVLRVLNVSFRNSQDETLVEMLQYPRFDVLVKNFGRTPAFLTQEAVCIAVGKLGDAPDYSSGFVDLPPSRLIEAGDPYILKDAPQHEAFGPDEITAILGRKHALYVYGLVGYTDFLRAPHISRFFFELIIRPDGSRRMLEIYRAGYSDGPDDGGDSA
jgi:hypothetical protein